MFPAYFSLAAADTCNGTFSAYQRGLFNTYAQDSIARASFFHVPIVTTNNFLYSTFGMGSLESTMNNIWNLSLDQYAWRMNNPQGFSSWYAPGACSTPSNPLPAGAWTQTLYPWMQPGANTTTVGSTSSGNVKIETAEDREYKAKFDKMKKYVEAILKENEKYSFDNDIPTETVAVIKEAMDLKSSVNKDKTMKEVYETFKKAYAKISDETIVEYITENKSVNVLGGKDDKNSFYKRLKETGYEFTGEEIDKEISVLRKALDNSSNNDTNLETKTGVVSQILLDDSIEILDVISSWNSSYRKTDNKGIILYIKGKKPSSTEKNNQYDTLINDLSKKLSDKANNVAKSLKEESKTLLEEKAEALTEAVESSTRNYETISKAFDELYAYTRLAAMNVLRRDANRYYGDFDPSMFDRDLLKEEVTNDLEKEGFSLSDYTESVETNAELEVVEHDENAGSTTSSTSTQGANNENKQEKTVNKVEDYSTTTSQTITENGVEYVVRETNDSKVKFVVKEDGKIYKVDGDTITNTTISESDLKSANSTAKEKQEIDGNMQTSGAKVSRVLYQNNTPNNVDRHVKNTLANLNQENIISFLDGIYAKDKWNYCQKFFEKMTDDGKGNDDYNTEKLNLIKQVIDKATSLGIDNKYLDQLQGIYDDYATEDGLKYGCNFDERYGTWWESSVATVERYANMYDKKWYHKILGSDFVGFGVGLIAGMTTADKLSYAEVVDHCIKKLYDEIKEVEKENRALSLEA